MKCVEQVPNGEYDYFPSLRPVIMEILAYALCNSFNTLEIFMKELMSYPRKPEETRYEFNKF